MSPYPQHYHGADPETLALLESVLDETWNIVRTNDTLDRSPREPRLQTSLFSSRARASVIHKGLRR